MTAKEAYAIIRRENSDKVLMSCLEFKDFYGFCLVPKGMEENEQLGGVGLDTVNKTTGEIGYFYPTQDLKAFREAKRIDLNE